MLLHILFVLNVCDTGAVDNHTLSSLRFLLALSWERFKAELNMCF